jgi:methanogenic corrinoid protein MtbC1
METVGSELIPRMYLSHRAGPIPPSLGMSVGRRLTDAERAEFLRLVRGSSEGAAVEMVRELVSGGVPVEAVYLDLLTPAARALGEEWERDTCDFVEVTVALGRMQRVLRGLAAFSAEERPEGAVGAVLLSTVPGEQHTLGLLIVAEFFLRAGWSIGLGAPLEPTPLEELVAEQWYDAVGISVSCTARTAVVADLVATLRRRSRNPRLVVLVGGCLCVGRPDLAKEMGADGTTDDAAGAPTLAARLAGLEQS